jgi:hypothetical protein
MRMMIEKVNDMKIKYWELFMNKMDQYQSKDLSNFMLDIIIYIYKALAVVIRNS